MLIGKNTLETSGKDVKTTLETSGKDVKNTLETSGKDEKNTLETRGEDVKNTLETSVKKGTSVTWKDGRSPMKKGRNLPAKTG
jgi:hypothetical protein